MPVITFSADRNSNCSEIFSEAQHPWHDGGGKCHQTTSGNSTTVFGRKKVPPGCRKRGCCFDKKVR